MTRGAMSVESIQSSNKLNAEYKTRLGYMYCGQSEELLSRHPLTTRRNRIQLVFTSPPFPLNRKKRYGNLVGAKYLEWLRGFAPLLRDYLTADGSIVIEVGNAWESGSPTMSTLPIEALLAFKEAGKFHLCQEFICHNPARLPGPAQWVNIERCRVKDSFTRLWWLSPTPRPRATNRNVLVEYSDSMKLLLKRKRYNSGMRPSEHSIGTDSFLTSNGGAIPSNVLTIANTASNDPFSVRCRELGLKKHPARMPDKLVEFFLSFLTEPGEIVLDPFAGSNTTGHVAERLGRRWIGIEASEEYARLSRHRFEYSE
jgi:DNA modification methylase